MTGKGDFLDSLLEQCGLDKRKVSNCQFIKTAMIGQVMSNLNMYHEKEHGKSLWDEAGFNDVLSKTAGAVSVSELCSAPTVADRVDIILKELGNQNINN